MIPPPGSETNEHRLQVVPISSRHARHRIPSAEFRRLIQKGEEFMKLDQKLMNLNKHLIKTPADCSTMDQKFKILKISNHHLWSVTAGDLQFQHVTALSGPLPLMRHIRRLRVIFSCHNGMLIHQIMLPDNLTIASITYQLRGWHWKMQCLMAIVTQIKYDNSPITLRPFTKFLIHRQIMLSWTRTPWSIIIIILTLHLKSPLKWVMILKTLYWHPIISSQIQLLVIHRLSHPLVLLFLLMQNNALKIYHDISTLPSTPPQLQLKMDANLMKEIMNLGWIKTQSSCRSLFCWTRFQHHRIQQDL